MVARKFKNKKIRLTFKNNKEFEKWMEQNTSWSKAEATIEEIFYLEKQETKYFLVEDKELKDYE